MDKEELFRNKLHIESPTSISLGYNTWYNLDTKLVGRVKKMIDENQQLQNRINKAIEFIDNHMYEEYCYVGSEDKLKEILKGKSE